MKPLTDADMAEARAARAYVSGAAKRARWLSDFERRQARRSQAEHRAAQRAEEWSWAGADAPALALLRMSRAEARALLSAECDRLAKREVAPWKSSAVSDVAWLAGRILAAEETRKTLGVPGAVAQDEPPIRLAIIGAARRAGVTTDVAVCAVDRGINRGKVQMFEAVNGNWDAVQAIKSTIIRGTQ